MVCLSYINAKIAIKNEYKYTYIFANKRSADLYFIPLEKIIIDGKWINVNKNTSKYYKNILIKKSMKQFYIENGLKNNKIPHFELLYPINNDVLKKENKIKKIAHKISRNINKFKKNNKLVIFFDDILLDSYKYITKIGGGKLKIYDYATLIIKNKQIHIITDYYHYVILYSGDCVRVECLIPSIIIKEIEKNINIKFTQLMKKVAIICGCGIDSFKIISDDCVVIEDITYHIHFDNNKKIITQGPYIIYEY